MNDSGSWSKTSNSENERLNICRGLSFHEQDGTCIGEHEGAHFYTVGQRKGLGIGGQSIPLFVAGTDTSENTIYVAAGEHHAALARNGLLIRRDELHWIRPSIVEGKQELQVKCRIRYRQTLFNATVNWDETYAYVLFEQTQYGVAKGQFAAFYIEEELVGSGVIYE